MKNKKLILLFLLFAFAAKGQVNEYQKCNIKANWKSEQNIIKIDILPDNKTLAVVNRMYGNNCSLLKLDTAGRVIFEYDFNSNGLISLEHSASGGEYYIKAIKGKGTEKVFTMSFDSSGKLNKTDSISIDTPNNLSNYLIDLKDSGYLKFYRSNPIIRFNSQGKKLWEVSDSNLYLVWDVYPTSDRIYVYLYSTYFTSRMMLKCYDYSGKLIQTKYKASTNKYLFGRDGYFAKDTSNILSFFYTKSYSSSKNWYSINYITKFTKDLDTLFEKSLSDSNKQNSLMHGIWYYQYGSFDINYRLNANFYVSSTSNEGNFFNFINDSGSLIRRCKISKGICKGFTNLVSVNTKDSFFMESGYEETRADGSLMFLDDYIRKIDFSSKGKSVYITTIKEINYRTTFTLYPNPTQSTFTINHNTLQKEELNIYNVLGAVVYNTQLQPTQTEKTIDVSALPKGVYIIRLGLAVEKVVVR